MNNSTKITHYIRFSDEIMQAKDIDLSSKLVYSFIYSWARIINKKIPDNYIWSKPVTFASFAYFKRYIGVSKQTIYNIRKQLIDNEYIYVEYIDRKYITFPLKLFENSSNSSWSCPTLLFTIEELNLTEKIALAYLYRYSKIDSNNPSKRISTITNKKIIELLSLTKQAVINILNSLEKKGYISKETIMKSEEFYNNDKNPKIRALIIYQNKFGINIESQIDAKEYKKIINYNWLED